jgi:hypothetical protein
MIRCRSGCLALIQIEAWPGKPIVRSRSDSGVRERQPHLKPGITRFRIGMNAAAVLLHNPLDRIEPQSCALAHPLSREKRFKHVCSDFRRDSCAAIANFDHHTTIVA